MKMKMCMLVTAKISHQDKYDNEEIAEISRFIRIGQKRKKSESWLSCQNIVGVTENSSREEQKDRICHNWKRLLYDIM